VETALQLVVGLGNPGSAYDATRHNIGFQVIRALASKKGWAFHAKPSLEAELAQGALDDRKVLLLLPITYMNSSGEAVNKCIQYFKVPLDQLLVVVDDVYLPFSEMRFREKGSAGGHNGLKSIEAHVNSQHYARLRIGVGEPQREDLADYVLGKFTVEEAKQLPEIIDKATEVVEAWLREGMKGAFTILSKNQNKAKSEGE
jgi:PTH1 family peptidyl-tRNA hydrolase